VNILSSFFNKARKDLVLPVFLLLAFGGQNAFAVNVTVTIGPLAGVVAPLLGEDDRLTILLKPGMSPHDFQMKPSDVKKLYDSDLVIWVGTPVDSWVQKSLENVKASSIGMGQLSGLKTLPIRQGGLWDKKKHHHAEHDHENEHEQNQSYHAVKRFDGHLWMSFDNVQLLIGAVANELKRILPDQAKDIQLRKEAWLKQLQLTDAIVLEKLMAVKHKPFLVLHDAFQYFEKRYQLTGVGSIRLNPSVAPSLKRVDSLRKRIQAGDVRCVFKEPQFPEKRVLAITKGLGVNVGSLDPIGLVLSGERQDDYLAYDQFMLKLASQFEQCLSKP